MSVVARPPPQAAVPPTTLNCSGTSDHRAPQTATATKRSWRNAAYCMDFAFSNASSIVPTM
jgi:hypothetical protein